MTPRLRVIVSTLALASLTACSKAPLDSEKTRTVVVSPIELKLVHPALPAPVKLHDIEWDVCGKKLCTTPRHVEKDLNSKLEMNRWVGSARDVIRFYRKEEDVPDQLPENKQ